MGTSNPEALRQLAVQRELIALVKSVQEDTKIIREAVGPSTEPGPEYYI